MALLEVQALSRNFDGVLAVNELSFAIAAGETVSVIGPNGAGKTTLFNLITGFDQPTRGEIIFDGGSLRGLRADQRAQLGIARTFQHGRVFGNLSVLENVLVGAHARRHAARPRTLLAGLCRELFEALIMPREARGEEAQLRAEAEGVLARFGERLLPRSAEPAYRLSYANRRRLELARALALRPRLLLLDEPTAGMNPAETEEMVALIRTLQTDHDDSGAPTILLIEHKLSLVMSLSDRMIVMDQGHKIAEGSPEAVRRDPRVIEAYLGHAAPATWARARQPDKHGRSG